MAAIHEQFRVAQRWFREHYTQMFYGLLPNGFIWKPRFWELGRVVQDIYTGDYGWEDTDDSEDEIQDVIQGAGDGDLLMRIFAALAGELERVEAAAWDLFDQSCPGLSTSLLGAWETDLGLPEECYAGIELTEDVDRRQAIAHEKYYSAGATTTRQWYIDYAESLGFIIDVTESPVETNPAICGVAICGVNRCGGQGGYSNLIVHILEAELDTSVLECMLDKAKQAHVRITYIDYTSSGTEGMSEIRVTGTGTRTITFRGTGSVYIYADDADSGESDTFQTLELLGPTTDVEWSHDYVTTGTHYIRFYEAE